MPLLSTVGVRRLHRESGIHDGLLTLNPYFDLTLRARALADALAHGASDDDAAAAARRWTPRPRAGSSRSSSPPPRRGARIGWWRCSPTT
ncbi:hypothetical protein AB0G57_32025 [Streptomyces lavendulae]